MEIKDLAGLSGPLKRLVEVVSEAVGAVSRPYLIRRTADAKAYEVRIIAQALADSRKLLGHSDYENGKISILTPTDAVQQFPALSDRTASREKHQELKRQQNLESVAASAAEELKEDANVPDNRPEPDWVNRFFEIAAGVSTEQMQYLWGKILAGEIRAPGSFSLRTLDVLRSVSKEEAENFVKLGQYVFRAESKAFYIDPEAYIFKKDGAPKFLEILALKDAGLIFESDLRFSFIASKAGNSSHLIYGPLVVLFEREKDTPVIGSEVGLLTKVGMELLPLVTVELDMDYVGLAAKRFRADGVKVAWAPIKKIEGDRVHFGAKTYLPD
jgi:hypothetical protein